MSCLLLFLIFLLVTKLQAADAINSSNLHAKCSSRILLHPLQNVSELQLRQSHPSMQKTSCKAKQIQRTCNIHSSFLPSVGNHISLPNSARSSTSATQGIKLRGIFILNSHLVVVVLNLLTGRQNIYIIIYIILCYIYYIYPELQNSSRSKSMVIVPYGVRKLIARHCSAQALIPRYARMLASKHSASKPLDTWNKSRVHDITCIWQT